MPKPISRREMLRRLRLFGWNGPFPGGKHMIMLKDNRSIHIPNPHGSDVDWSLMKRVLTQAEIDSREWDQAGR